MTELRLADSELVVRARSGTEAARAMLYERHAKRVLGLLVRLLNCRADAEDAAQDAFLEAFRDLPRLRDPGGFGAWLTRIAVSHAHRRFRKRKLLGLVGLADAPDATLDTLLDPAASPEVRAEWTLLQRQLDRLPLEVRSAWVLRYVEGHELTEVADALSISLATAKRRLVAAQAALAAAGVNAEGAS